MTILTNNETGMAPFELTFKTSLQHESVESLTLQRQLSALDSRGKEYRFQHTDNKDFLHAIEKKFLPMHQPLLRDKTDKSAVNIRRSINTLIHMEQPKLASGHTFEVQARKGWQPLRVGPISVSKGSDLRRTLKRALKCSTRAHINDAVTEADALLLKGHYPAAYEAYQALKGHPEYAKDQAYIKTQAHRLKAVLLEAQYTAQFSEDTLTAFKACLKAADRFHEANSADAKDIFTRNKILDRTAYFSVLFTHAGLDTQHKDTPVRMHLPFDPAEAQGLEAYISKGRFGFTDTHPNPLTPLRLDVTYDTDFAKMYMRMAHFEAELWFQSMLSQYGPIRENDFDYHQRYLEYVELVLSLMEAQAGELNNDYIDYMKAYFKLRLLNHVVQYFGAGADMDNHKISNIEVTQRFFEKYYTGYETSLSDKILGVQRQLAPYILDLIPQSYKVAIHENIIMSDGDKSVLNAPILSTLMKPLVHGIRSHIGICKDTTDISVYEPRDMRAQAGLVAHNTFNVFLAQSYKHWAQRNGARYRAKTHHSSLLFKTKSGLSGKLHKSSSLNELHLQLSAPVSTRSYSERFTRK